MREEVMSALTAERAVHEPMGDDPMEIGAVGKSGKKGTGKKGKGKNDQNGRGKGPGQGKKRLRDPEPPCRSRVLLLSPQGPHQRGVQNSYRRREGHEVQGRERQEKGRTVTTKGKETSECDGRSRT